MQQIIGGRAGMRNAQITVPVFESKKGNPD
jgi:hypothetical protein